MRFTAVLLRSLLATLLVAFTIAPTLAKPIVVAELGSYPLLGSSTNLSELQVSIARNEDRLAIAGRMIGLSAAEYRAFRIATQTQRPQYGLVPQRLDAMSWYSYGQVHVIHDVQIPKASYGFEYDETTPNEQVRIFLPVACGNLSVLRERITRVAAVRPARRIAMIMPRPIATPAPVATPAAVQSPAPDVAETPPPTIYLGSRPGRGLFPFLGALFGFLTVAGGHSNGGNSGHTCYCPITH